MKKFRVKVNDNIYEVEVEEIKDGGSVPVPAPKATPAPAPTPIATQPPSPTKVTPPASTPSGLGAAGASAVKAPMPGVILSVSVKESDSVNAGDVLCVLEAMKLENELQAEKSGTVKEVKVSKGQNVNAGDVLFVIE